MDHLLELLLAWGWLGLAVATFTEAFISPLMPDLILVPLCLSDPANAINYAVLATVTSVSGGFVGYGLGFCLGPNLLRRFSAVRAAMGKVEGYSKIQVGWTIFLVVMSPLPYKVVSISAGALRINFPLFILVSLIGRGKRFLIEGLLIYFLGSVAIQLFEKYSLVSTILLVGVILVWGGVWWWQQRRNSGYWGRARSQRSNQPTPINAAKNDVPRIL